MGMISEYIGGAYELPSFNASHRISQNLYMQSTEGEGKAAYILLNTPGSKLFMDVQSIVGPLATCRGMHYSSRGTLFVCYGQSIIEIEPNPDIFSTTPYISTQRMVITNLSSRISMADNGKFLAVVDGSIMNYLDMIDYTISTPNLPFNLPLQVIYLEQRFYCITADPSPTLKDGRDDGIKRNMIWWSNIGTDGSLTWDALSYASAESSADPIIGLAVRQGDLIMYGPSSYEIWATTGNNDLPISYNGGSSSKIGCDAPYSIATIGDQAFHLGSSAGGTNIVFMTNAYSMDRISDHAIEARLQRSGDAVKAAIGWTYQMSGHVFYILTIPYQQGNAYSGFTIVFDTQTGKWHTRSTRDPLTNSNDAWAPLFGVYAFGKVLVGNLTDAVVLELDPDTYTDWSPVSVYTPDGTKPRVCKYTGPQMWADLRLVQHFEFQLDFQPGVGLITGQGTNPQAMFRVSNDAGATWSSERWVSIGRVGQYAHRCRLKRCGISRMRVYEVTISDPVFVCIVGARTLTKPGGNP